MEDMGGGVVPANSVTPVRIHLHLHYFSCLQDALFDPGPMGYQVLGGPEGIAYNGFPGWPGYPPHISDLPTHSQAEEQSTFRRAPAACRAAMSGGAWLL